MAILAESITFPLTGGLATLSLGLEFVVVFCAFEIMIHFLVDYFRADDPQKRGRDFAWASVMLGIGLIYLFYIYTDFQIVDPLEREKWLNYSYVAFAFSAFAAIFLTELLERIKLRILTIIAIGVLLFVIIGINTLDHDTVMTFATISAISLAVLYYLFYFYRLLKLTNFSKDVFTRVIWFLASLFMGLLGLIPSGDMVLQRFGMISRVIGDFILILSFPIFFRMLQKLPHFGEFDWKRRIRAVIVYEDHGIALFSHFWDSTSNEQNQQLITASLNSIQSMFSQLHGDQKFHTVNMANKCILFESKDQFHFVIIADEYLYSLQIRLRQFSEKFFGLFTNTIKNWDGNIDQFAGTKLIFDKIFPTQENLKGKN